MAIICEAIDEDFDEEFEKQAGDIQVAEYFTNKLKLLLGRNIDNEIRIDGTDEEEDIDSQKLVNTEETLITFERCLSRLDLFVDSVHEDLECEQQCNEWCNTLVETSLAPCVSNENGPIQNPDNETSSTQLEMLDSKFGKSCTSLDTVSEIIEL